MPCEVLNIEIYNSLNKKTGTPKYSLRYLILTVWAMSLYSLWLPVYSLDLFYWLCPFDMTEGVGEIERCGRERVRSGEGGWAGYISSMAEVCGGICCGHVTGRSLM